MENLSQKIKMVDRGTFENMKKYKPCESKQIKNGKHKKLHQSFDLTHFIRIKTNQRLKRTTLKIYKRRKPSTTMRRRNCSKLKKRILKYRLLKKQKQLLGSQRPVITFADSHIESVAECLQNLSLEQQLTKFQVHSRRFREYCDNLTSESLCSLLETLLRELYRFQKRLFQINESKGRSRRRVVCGFREVQNFINVNKLKLVIIATDCESCTIEEGLDSTIQTLKESCRKNGIPYVFAFSRRRLAYILFKKRVVSVVGVLSYDGMQDVFKKILDAIELSKYKYKTLLENRE